MAKDYSRSKNLDEKVVQLVLDGLELEKRKPSLDRFFHRVFDQFSVMKILVSRSICTVLCVFFIGTSLGKIFSGKDSVDSQYEIIMGLIGAALGAITCILYYSSYKKFEELEN